MNIIAGDLFTHLSVVIENPDVDPSLRSLYEQALSRLSTCSIQAVHPAAEAFPGITGNNLIALGRLFVNIYLLEQKPDDEEVPLTDE